MAENKFLGILKKILDRPHTLGELRKKIPQEYRQGIRRHLKPLVDDGEIVKMKAGRFGLPDMMNLISGIVQGHPNGFGFILPDDPKEEDIFLGPKNFRTAMHGDTVLCRVEKTQADGKRSGSVVRVVTRGRNSVIGLFESRGKGGVLIPVEKRITQLFDVQVGDTLRAKNGRVVIGKIVEYPEKHFYPTAKIVEILGYPDDVTVQRKIIIKEHLLSEAFPKKIEKDAGLVAEPKAKDFKNRINLQDDWIITIDGESAKDFDDAVSIKKTGKGYELGVHIADVSSYVKHQTALDAEAFERGNSTYFPGSVIPMLPFNLSDNVCSLRPDVERLTLSAFMKFDKNGKMTDYSFAPSVIKSRHRMTYKEVAKIIENPRSTQDATKREKLLLMNELSNLLIKKRTEEGSIDLDLPEPFIILDIQGEPSDIITTERNDAHRLIENFMLVANKAAALFLDGTPALYRVHPSPDSEKLETFFDFAKRLGHIPKPKESLHLKMQKVLLDAVGKPDEKLLNYMLLRSMKQASYSSDNIGHFGLAFSHYTHFTSPIRRYPDLIVHRLIKAKLLGKQAPYDENELTEISAQTSKKERNSESAERAVVDMLKVRFVADRIGDEFDGIITGVTSFGIFIELSDIMVEGLLRMSDLHDDYYDFLEKEYAIVGKRSGKKYRLGQAIRVRIKSADIIRREVELVRADTKVYSAKVTKVKKAKGGKKSFKGRRRKKS